MVAAWSLVCLLYYTGGGGDGVVSLSLSIRVLTLINRVVCCHAFAGHIIIASMNNKMQNKLPI